MSICMYEMACTFVEVNFETVYWKISLQSLEPRSKALGLQQAFEESADWDLLSCLCNEYLARTAHTSYNLHMSRRRESQQLF